MSANTPKRIPREEAQQKIAVWLAALPTPRLEQAFAFVAAQIIQHLDSADEPKNELAAGLAEGLVYWRNRVPSSRGAGEN